MTFRTLWRISVVAKLGNIGEDIELRKCPYEMSHLLILEKVSHAILLILS
jgi:hypothetical protein